MEIKRVGKMPARLPPTAMDLRGEPITICICGSKVWNIQVQWDEVDDTIGMYFADMWCPFCDSIATAPMPERGDYGEL